VAHVAVLWAPMNAGICIRTGFFFLTRRATASLRRRKLFHADRPVKVQLHDMMRKLEVQIQSLLNSALYAG